MANFLLSAKAIKNLECILTKFDFAISVNGRDCKRYEEIDKLLEKESNNTPETLRGRAANKMGDKSKIANIEIPLTEIQKSTVLAYLTGTFLTGHPIFAAVSTREKEEAAAMLTALSARDEQQFGWMGELLQALDNTLSYNVGPVEVIWSSKRTPSAKTKIEGGNSTKTATVSSVLYEGNKIKALDPYNVFWDRSVPPHKVHSEGTYAGYVERLNYIQLKLRYHDWNSIYTIKVNIDKIFSGQCGPGSNAHYYAPQVRLNSNAFDPNNWQAFFGNIPTHQYPAEGNKRSFYEVVTMYSKIIPKEYDVSVPSAGEPQLFKMIWVNGLLAYVEPVVVGHAYLPIIIGQYRPGGTDNKSFVEFLEDLQNLSTALMTATLASMRRAVGDRMVYNPRVFRKEDIDSPNPTSKIPMITNAYNNDVRTAIMQIPFVDNISPNFQANIGFAVQLAEESTGANRAARGSFVKGNKTRHEFDTVMGNAESRMQLGALRMETNFFSPIKEIIKINYLIQTQTQTIQDRATDTTVEIDPVLLREVAPDFKMADGIMPSTKLANTDVLIQGVNAMMMDPILSVEYDVGGIIISALQQQGFPELHKYKRTPEQQQQVLAMRQQQTQAETPPDATQQ